MADTTRKWIAAGPQRFRPYPDYKDSGVEWVGEIPAHWKSNRLKYLCRRSALYGANEPTESYVYDGIRFLRTSDIDDKGRLSSEGAVFLPREIVCEYILKNGDLLISRSGTLGRALHYRHRLHGECAYAGYLVRFEPSDELCPQFAYYFTKSVSFHQWLSFSAIQSTIGNIIAQKYANMPLPVPKTEEQRAIAAFLDRETEKIDALIAKKERLIELLQEKRTALITRAVTKGLDSNVPMKDSGVEWLGKIPAHWECLALSRVSLARCDGPFGSGLKSEHYSESGVRVVRLQNIGSAEFCDADRAYINEEYGSQLGDHRVLPGDLLIAGLGDDAHPVGRACVAPEYIVPAMVKADCFRFRLDIRLLLARFAAYQLSSTAAAAAGALSTGATRSRLNLTAMTTRKVALPPLREQAAIVSVLDRSYDESCVVIAKIREAIKHLKEYRTALISAAVIGKIDVR